MYYPPPFSLRGVFRHIYLFTAVALLSGCVTLGPLPDAAQPVAADWRHRGVLTTAPGADPATWWSAFNDPVLDALVTQTLVSNLNLAQAGHRLRSARALVRPALAQQRPQIAASASGQWQQRLSGPGNIDFQRSELSPDGLLLREEGRSGGDWKAGFDAAWEIDLFGRASAGVTAARAAAEGAEAEAEMARVSVVAEVVRSYVELRAAQQRQALLAANADDQNRLVALARERRDAGIGSDLDVDRSLTIAADTAAQLHLQGLLIGQAAQRIAVLTGQPVVDDALLLAAPQPQAGLTAMPMLPADLLRVRPDIRRAEHAVTQAAADLGVAVADLYPRLSLTGALQATGNLVGTVLPGRTSQALAGLSIQIPLLDWGARRAVVNAREAILAATIGGYRQAVLEGIEETENALNAVETQRSRMSEASVRLQAAQRADSHAEMLNRRGMTSLSDKLDAAIALRGAQLAGAEVIEQYALAVVALHKAVGGASLHTAQPMHTRI
ncbi:efflux transporter outer membrane subunit [Pantoea agglomerans]|uniref:efflux transporter outer membrane subunit n=1 Tax=Enterobacter agglomerans TaxID=549 RepID=UPI0010096437|nr:efflux transporter outer membrane subunit [Pantoea agglomerans]QAV47506.1 efflux transporter outer membrane subunit [Pantoea agglomerans]QAV52289.1 efflux transporter outer membrane subunit [Pantoea agglomerans]